MTELAHEVSRRVTPEHARERAREMAREAMMRTKDRAIESSWFGPLLGAGIGLLVAKAMQERALERRDRWERHEGWDGGARHVGPGSPYRWAGADAPRWGEAVGPATTWREPAPGAEPASDPKERARAAAEHARERIEEASEGIRERYEQASSAVRERVEDVSAELRERLPDREAVRASARDDTGLWALGALALGALFGFALPVSRREREALEPARRKVRELGHDLEERALEKGAQALEHAQQALAGGGERGATQSGTGAADDPAPLH